MLKIVFGARLRAVSSALRPLCAALIVVLGPGLMSGAASARDLPPIDALADAPVVKRDATQTVSAVEQRLTRLGFRGHTDPRLQSPTFVWTSDPHRLPTPGAAALSAEAAARAHLTAMSPLYTLAKGQAAALSLLDQTALPNGATLVRFRNNVGGVEVFREQVGVLMRADRSLIAVGGGLSPGQSSAGFAKLARLPVAARDAVATALADYDFAIASTAADLQAAGQRDGYQFFDLPPSTTSSSGARLAGPARVKQVYFRLAEGLVPAFYVEIQAADSAEAATDYYAYVVSAKNGDVLFRHNQTVHANFAYRVWADPSGIRRPLPGPQGDGFTPHPTGVPDGSQAPFVLPNLISLQNGPISTSDPWLADNATETNGNNVDAYVDLTAPDGLSAGDFRAATTATRTFDRTYDLTQEPAVSVDQRMAAITQLFYTVNWLHDDYYDLGFDEAAGNAQANNFGRGGVGNDAMKAEAQDYSGFDNANMSTPADGQRPRMQMYLFQASAGTTMELRLSGALSTTITFVNKSSIGPTAFNITAPLAAPVDGGGTSTTDGCEALVGNQAGRIVMLDTGNCAFTVKATNAQAAGAVGILFSDINPGGISYLGGNAPNILIPVLGISLADATNIRNALGGGITATMERVPGVTPDGALDNTVVAHEWGHYISNRLVQNASGLTNRVGGGMGEGWSDFHALLMIVKEGDDPADAYAMAGYDYHGPLPGGQANNGYYFGIRRYPYSTDLNKNPLMFRHIENGVALPVGPPRGGGGGSLNAQVHNTGEVWASMLWECYAALLADTPRLSFAEAQERMKRYVVAGYKLTPAAPTFVEARDAILAAALANDAQDFALCAAGFAKRGLGAGAIAPDRFDITHAGVVESTSVGAAIELLTTEVRDFPLFCDADGLLDNGETGTLTVTARNSGFVPLTATTVTLSSADARVQFPNGPSVSMPASQPMQEVSASVALRVAGVAGTAVVPITITASDGAAMAARQIQLRVNADDLPQSSASDDVEAPALSWTTRLQGLSTDGQRWSRRALAADSHVLYGPDNDVEGVTWLESPDLVVGAGQALTINFQHRYRFEWDGGDNYDGGVIEISTDGGGSWVDLDPSLYTGTLALGGNNPLEARSALVRDSAGHPSFVPVSITTGATYSGQTVRIRFGIGSDASVGAAGWEIDNVVVGGLSNTPFNSAVAHRNVCATLDSTEGDPQATAVGTAFPTTLKARLRDPAGQPLAGATVRFTAPASGASATFLGGMITRDVSTDASGFASTNVVANATVGSYQVTASSGLLSTTFALNNQVAVAGSAPSLSAASDTGISNSDGVTNAAELVFTGTCVSGDVVQLVETGSNVGTAVTCSGGAYSATAALNEGVHAIAATFRRGMTTSAPTSSVSVTVDHTAPAAPTIGVVTVLSSTTRQIAGTGLAGVVGHQVSVEEAGAPRCVATVQANGAWSCAATFASAGARSVSAIQIDAAGNRSAASAAIQITVSAGLFADGFEARP